MEFTSIVLGKDGKQHKGQFVPIQFDWQVVSGSTVTEINKNVRAAMEKEWETLGQLVIGPDGTLYQAMQQMDEIFIDEQGNEVDIA